MPARDGNNPRTSSSVDLKKKTSQWLADTLVAVHCLNWQTIAAKDSGRCKQQGRRTPQNTRFKRGAETVETRRKKKKKKYLKGRKTACKGLTTGMSQGLRGNECAGVASITKRGRRRGKTERPPP